MSRLSRDILAQAQMLARREPRRPKEASLRRSISASYYALFHFLIEDCTRLVVGTAHSRASLRQFTGRAFVHGKMKAVCEEFLKTTPKNELLRPFWPTLRIAHNAEIQTIANIFIRLQEQRHAADYDLSQHFTRDDAHLAARQSQEAIAAWNRLKVQNKDLSLFFALSLMLWPGLSGR